MKLKLDIDELKAIIAKIDEVRKPGSYVHVDFEMSSLKITTTDRLDNLVQVTIYDVSTQLLPKITKTEVVPVKKV